jgi:hypothetical protein
MGTNWSYMGRPQGLCLEADSHCLNSPSLFWVALQPA